MSKFFIPPNIGRFKKGVVVRVVMDTYHNMIGHVEGFGLNLHNELTVKVSLANGVLYEYHHCKLEVLSDVNFGD